MTTKSYETVEEFDTKVIPFDPETVKIGLSFSIRAGKRRMRLGSTLVSLYSFTYLEMDRKNLVNVIKQARTVE